MVLKKVRFPRSKDPRLTRRGYVRRRTKRRGKISYPRRRLILNYRSNNVYKFVRETVPEIISPTILAGTGTNANIGYFRFEDFVMDNLPNWTEFSNLFARYKVTCIVTTLIPMAYESTAQSDMSGLAQSLSVNAKVTRVNTKWLNKEFNIAANAETQLEELAQIQSKSTSLYLSRRPLKIVTKLPGMASITLKDPELAPDLATNQVVTRSPSKWLNTTDGDDVKLSHNSIIFMEKLDGSDLDSDSTNFGRYYMTHKIYFSCSQVG